MGYGWMAGLGQAMQQVGSEQVPQYLARRRQADQDKQAVEQRAIENALADKRAGIEQGQLDENTRFHTGQLDFEGRTADRADEENFLTNVMPSMYGRPTGELGQPLLERAAKYGILPGANGIFAPSQGTRLEQANIRSLDANAYESRKRGDAARVVAEDGRADRTLRNFASLTNAFDPNINYAPIYNATKDPMSGQADMGAVNEMALRQTVQALEARVAAARMMPTLPPEQRAHFQQQLAAAQQQLAALGATGRGRTAVADLWTK